MPASSQIAKSFAAELDKLGYIWIDEISTWIRPKENWTYEICDTETVRSMLFDFMDDIDTNGFTDGKLTGTFKLAGLKQKLKRRYLWDNYIALKDGLLDCRDFKFHILSPEYDEKKTYSVDDVVRFGTFEYECRKEGTKDTPPSTGMPWKMKQRHTKTALLYVDLDYSEIFDSDDKCPKWIEFLSEVFVMYDGKTPDEELIEYVSLFCGYTIMPHLKANKILMLYGPMASNGKSTFTKILKSMFPEELVSERKFKEFAGTKGTNWSKAELTGKRINICNEESSKDVDSGLLKEFSDGMSAIEARRLYQPPFTFIPQFKIITTFNTPPTFDNIDEGILRRFGIIPCHAEFRGNKHVDDIVGPILKETPEILAWMLRKAKKLMERKWMFPEDSEIMRITKREVTTEQNSVLSYCLNTFYTTKEGKGIPFDDIYQGYIEFCKTTGHTRPFSKVRFSQIANKKYLGESKASNGIRYRMCRRFKGEEKLIL